MNNSQPKINVSNVFRGVMAILLPLYGLYLIFFGFIVFIVSQVTLAINDIGIFSGIFLFLKGLAFIIISIGLLKMKKWVINWFVGALILSLSAFFINFSEWDNLFKEILLVLLEFILFVFIIFKKKDLVK